MTVATSAVTFLAIRALRAMVVMDTTRLQATLVATIPMMLTKAESTKVALLVTLALTIATILRIDSAAGPAIFQMITLALVALELTTS